MTRFIPLTLIGTLLPAIALGSDTTYTDPCIDAVRAENGDAVPPGGQVISQSYSEAGTLVMLEDGAGTVWRCISYRDGTVGELTKIDTAATEPVTETTTVRFDPGTSGAELTGSLTPGSTHRYVLGAANEQFLYTRVVSPSGGLEYQIFNPDQSLLLDMIPEQTEYRGQLFMTGDHVIEVINRTNADQGYSVIFGIE